MHQSRWLYASLYLLYFFLLAPFLVIFIAAFYLEISDKQIPPWAALNRHFHANYCFLFGIPPGSAGIRLNMPLYRPLTYREVTYLCSDSLEKIRLEREAGDNRAAGALWKALLEIFPKA